MKVFYVQTYFAGGDSANPFAAAAAATAAVVMPPNASTAPLSTPVSLWVNVAGTRVYVTEQATGRVRVLARVASGTQQQMRQVAGVGLFAGATFDVASASVCATSADNVQAAGATLYIPMVSPPTRIF